MSSVHMLRFFEVLEHNLFKNKTSIKIGYSLRLLYSIFLTFDFNRTLLPEVNKIYVYVNVHKSILINAQQAQTDKWGLRDKYNAASVSTSC